MAHDRERRAAFPFAPTLTPADDGAHDPGPEANWQESSLVAFVDPVRGLAGFHRIGVHPNKAEASLYSWTQVDGEMISQAKRTALPLPDGPVTATCVEGVSFSTPDPLRSCRIEAERDGAHTNVLFESFTGPVQMNMDVGGATIGKGHYDSLGRVSGVVSRDGVEQPFDGVGFLDHSWGARDGGSILCHRWIMAALDADNHVNVFPTIGPRGRAMLGYVVIDGEFSYADDVVSELAVGDDHLEVRSARVRVIDKLGRSIELQGSAAGAYGVQPYGHGYFAVHRPFMWRLKGRAAPGMLEWSPMRFVPPWRREALGLARDNELLQWNGQQP